MAAALADQFLDIPALPEAKSLFAKIGWLGVPLGLLLAVVLWVAAIVVFGYPAFIIGALSEVAICFGLLMWVTLGGTTPSDKI